MKHLQLAVFSQFVRKVFLACFRRSASRGNLLTNSVYSGGQNVGGNFHQISARKPVLLSFNTVFPYKNVGGQDLHRQNVGGNYPPQPPTWGVIINTGYKCHNIGV